MTPATQKSSARSRQSSPVRSATFERTLREALDAELEQEFRDFFRGADLAARYYLRDILRACCSGDGILTATLAAEGDSSNCYVKISRDHFELVRQFVNQLENGRATLQPIGSNWAIWKRPAAPDHGGEDGE